MASIDVSVVVATYNSDINSIKKTLYSVLIQKKIAFEVVVADDGSADNHKDEILDFFQEFDFHDYMFSICEKNVGTVNNIISALKVCNGKYLKLISPGDYLYCPDTLFYWITFMQLNRCLISFGRYVKYDSSDDKYDVLVKSLKLGDRPWNLKPYIGDDQKAIKYRYLLLDDFCLGAAVLTELSVFEKYIGIINGSVKYAEDAVYRLMIADGIYPRYFDEITIWYSYGDGISTNRNKKWWNIINYDHFKAGLIISKRIEKSNWFNIRYKLLLNVSNIVFLKAVLKYVLFPTLFFYRLTKYNNLQGCEIDCEFIKNIWEFEKNET